MIHKNNILAVLDSLREVSFPAILTSKNFVQEIIKPLEQILKNKVSYDFGYTKGVIFTDGYVLKIPFLADEKGSLFTGAFSYEGWDYCEAEVKLYGLAEIYGVEKAFLKTLYFGTIQRYPIYIQHIIDLMEPPIIKHTNFNASQFCREHDLYCFDEDWIEQYAYTYSEKDLLKLYEFLEEENIIGDLHSDNLGYYHQKPVIVDYAGFYE